MRIEIQCIYVNTQIHLHIEGGRMHQHFSRRAGWLIGYIVFANLTQTGLMWGEGTSTEVATLSDWPGWCGRTRPTSWVPSAMASDPVPASGLLSRLPLITDYNLLNPFLSVVLRSWCFITATESKWGQQEIKT